MTQDERKVIELALKACENIVNSLATQDDEGMIEHAQQMIDARDAITAMKELLAQPEQEPVAWIYESVCGNNFSTCIDPPSYAKNIRPLYNTSPQRKPLTDEMHQQMKESCDSDNMEMRGAFIDGWTSAEAAHGIKE